MVTQSTKSQIIYTTIRISKEFHAWIFGKGKKGESYDDVLQRISGYKPEVEQPSESIIQANPSSTESYRE